MGSRASPTQTYKVVHHYEMKLKLVHRQPRTRTRRMIVMHHHEERHSHGDASLARRVSVMHNWLLVVKEYSLAG